MFARSEISELYANVLDWEIDVHNVKTARMKVAIQSMYHVYSPDTTDFDSTFPEMADFNDVAFRCAYLHKYAPLHTYIVFDVMLKVLKEQTLLFQNLVESERFKMCCLGGGPGSDVIGVLSALYGKFGIFKSSATIIDCMQNWEYTFASIVYELMIGGYDEAWSHFADNFEWQYVGADLLQGMTNEVNASIGSSSLVTMIKFLSAAACQNTEHMINIIFRVMKPGALLLFIDNAGGGFTQLMVKSAQENGFVSLFGPLQHVRYSEEAFKIYRFGYNSCYSTNVTTLLLQKPFNHVAKRKYTPLSEHNNVPIERTLLYTEKKIKKASALKYVPEMQIDSKSSTGILPVSRSKIENSNSFLPSSLQLSVRNNISPIPEKGNIKTSSLSPLFKQEDAKNAQIKVSPISTACQPIVRCELPTSHVRLDEKFPKTEFTAGSYLSKQACITNHTSTTVQQFPVGTNYNAVHGLKPNAMVSTSPRYNTSSAESKPMELPIKEYSLNTAFEGIRSLYLAKNENKALHHNGIQEVKHSPNPSNAEMAAANDIRFNIIKKIYDKVSSLRKKNINDDFSNTSQSTSVAGTSCRPLLLGQRKSVTNIQGVASGTYLLPVQNENKVLPQDQFEGMKTASTHSVPFIDDDARSINFQKSDVKGSLKKKFLTLGNKIKLFFSNTKKSS